MSRNVFFALFATALFAWPLAGCGDDDTGPACTDPCDTELDTRCNGSTLQTCESDAEGCLDWADTTDCSATGQQCQHPVGENALCVFDCTDECSEPDITQCSGSVIQTCATQANTCLGWEDGTDCADSGQLCEDATGDAVCTDTCIDECTTLNDTQCGGTAIQTCMLNTDGCNDWVDTIDCADSSQICDDSSGTPTCVVDCSAQGPAVPMNPDPTDGATSVNGTLSMIDWSDSIGAVSWDYYFGPCPVPAYPDPAFVSVGVSEATGLTLDYNTTYCWQAVPLDADGCATEGPEWIFSTGACADPMPGAPQVISATNLTLAPGNATYTLTFSEAVFQMDMTALTWTPVTGTGTLDSVTAVNAQTYDLQISGTADGDVYTLTVGTQVEDGCGNALSAAVDIQIFIITGGAPGLSCAGPATTSSPNYYSGGGGHHCWAWPQDTADNNNDHLFTCDSGVGGDVVIEYTTGPTDTALSWAASISNYQSSGYIRVEVTDSPCATGSSLYCTSSTGTQADVGAVAVTPNTTYYIWLVDGYSGHYRPDINACVWSDNSCIDTVAGPPVVTSTDVLLPPGSTAGIYTLTFNEDVTGVDTTSVTLNPVVGSGTIGSITPVSGDSYDVSLIGMADGDEYELTVATTVSDLCGNAMTAPVTVTILVEAPLQDGNDCTDAADTTSVYHSVDGNGHDCWTLPGGTTDTTSDHFFPCGFGAGGDVVIEYTTGPTDTALHWDALISNGSPGGFIALDIIQSPCATGSSLYCAMPFGMVSDAGSYPVSPNTTYYIWVAEGMMGSYRPTVDACIWSDNQCIDLVLGPPLVTSPLTGYLASGSTGTYTLTFNEPVTDVNTTNVTLTPLVGTGSISAINQVDPQTYEVVITGLSGGDQLQLTVGTGVLDACGTPLAGPVDILIDTDPLLVGGSCSDPATVGGTYHSVDVNGHDCWTFPSSLGDNVSDHVYTCDTATGGDIVVEFTTGPTDTALYWDTTISNYQVSGYIGVEVTDSPCVTGSSLYCTAGTGVYSDTGVVPVSPNTTYYVWVTDAYAGHLRPDIDACLWADNTCIDPIVGPPSVTSMLTPVVGEPSGTYVLTFDEPVNPVTLADLTWTPVVGTGTLDSVTPLSPTQYEVAYSGVVVGDSYILTVATSVSDLCGNALAAPVDVNMTVSSVTCNEGGGSCAAPLPLNFVGNTAIHYGEVQTSTWDWNTPTSHFWSFVATSATVNISVNLDQVVCNDLCGAGGTNGAWPGVGIFNPSDCMMPLAEDTVLQDCVGTMSVTYSSLVPGNTYIVQFRSDEPAYGPYDYELTVVH